MARKRKFSAWRSVLKDDSQTISTQEQPGYVRRKRKNTLSNVFFSPWQTRSDLDASQFSVVSAPRKNTDIFLRNSSIDPEVQPQFTSGQEKIDILIKLLVGGSVLLALGILAVLLLR